MSLLGLVTFLNIMDCGDYFLADTNLNFGWAFVCVQTLHKLGLEYVIIAPGSRNVPLALTFAKHKKMEVLSILDERSAAFFALGLAKRTNKPVALVCTSGTAGANFYPAVIEASASNIPLFIITADRPASARYSHTRQITNQLDLFGRFTRFHAEISLPKASLNDFSYLRQLMIQAYERAIMPQPGPIHLNMPFDEPLDPIEEPEFRSFFKKIDWERFFSAIHPPIQYKNKLLQQDIPQDFYKQKGIIIIGTVHPENPEEFAKTISQISEKLAWPVLGEALSPARHYASKFKYLISNYDSAVGNKNLEPDVILRIGLLPSSKRLYSYLSILDCPVYILDPYFDNIDPLHKKTTHLRIDAHVLLEALDEKKAPKENNFAMNWVKADTAIQATIDTHLGNEEKLFEGKVAWLLSMHLPLGTAVFASTSRPVRDAEHFWKKSDKGYIFYFNKGVNGIDGLTSTALGVAHKGLHTVLLIGDLSFLHDTNALLSHPIFRGKLTIIIINNNGGGIFHQFPAAKHKHIKDQFAKYIITPQSVSIAMLVKAYNIAYFNPQNWSDFTDLIQQEDFNGLRIIELKTNRHYDHNYRQNLLTKCSQYCQMDQS